MANVRIPSGCPVGMVPKWTLCFIEENRVPEVSMHAMVVSCQGKIFDILT